MNSTPARRAPRARAAAAVLAGALALFPGACGPAGDRPAGVEGLPARFSHALLDGVLGRHVRKGMVDYEALRGDPGFAAYLAQLAGATPWTFPAAHERAFWINAWNALALKGVLDHYPVSSIRDIAPSGRQTFFRGLSFRAGGRVVTLDDIEHKILRAAVDEPRIHFALAWPAAGGPKLRSSAYHAERLDQELDEATRAFVQDPVRVRLDREGRVLSLSPLFEWYGEDFERAAGSVAAWVGRYLPPVDRMYLTKNPVEIRWLEFDWSLNDRRREDPASDAPR